MGACAAWHDGGSQSLEIALRGFSFATGAWKQVDIANTDKALVSSWTLLSADYTVTQKVDGLDVYLWVNGAAAADGVLIDDVRLVRTQ
jgi:phage tail tube protein FII